VQRASEVREFRGLGDDLATRGIKLSLGGQVYDPTDPIGKMFFNILATFAGFEVDLLRMPTREGMAVARARGKLRGKQPKLSPRQQRELVRMAGTGEYTITDLAELFSVSRTTVYRTLQRHDSSTR
jgi:DNA invertase Pin-like site-specific DNA recombinase